MVSMRFPSPSGILQQVNWRNLLKAHALVKQCQVVPGIQQYKRLLLNQLARYFYERRWDYSDDRAEMSLNWACVYLAEYHMKERVWADWLDSSIHPSSRRKSYYRRRHT